MSDTNSNDLESVKRTLLVLNRPFISNLWDSTLIEADALVEMLGLDLISFTEEYDMKEHLTLFEESKDMKQAVPKIHKLTFDEEMALKNIDLTKEETVNIYRYDNPSGGYRYALSPDKQNKMNDDRSYCLAMLAWKLQQLRRKNITGKQKSKNMIFLYN
ncbi:MULTISPECIES: hypothetical protein [unclassified Paenibacillus]|uniref:hypothetical protein n=1 Tax=unclassified Paenibacillus TaxID=185978 RepID=UPI001E4BC1E2|nr:MULTISPECIES: hypothetical protein [unclassified Paenibacillus]